MTSFSWVLFCSSWHHLPSQALSLSFISWPRGYFPSGILLPRVITPADISTTPTIHKIPLIPPLPKGEMVIPLFGKEGRGEIF